MKAMQLVAVAAAWLAAWSGTGAAAQGIWLGAFGHAPTAYNLSPPVTVTGRDGSIRMVPPNYAAMPPYAAESTVREVVRLSAAAASIRIRFSNEFSDKALRIAEVHIALAAANGA